MPIWLELTVLMLVAYAAGLAIGWAIWGRRTVENDGNG
jgi:phosphate/sulfate permease